MFLIKIYYLYHIIFRGTYYEQNNEIWHGYNFCCSRIFGTSYVSNNDGNVQAASIYKNCTAFNSKYHHGVKSSSKIKNKVKKRNGTIVYEYSPAKVSASIYKTAMKYNSDLDRDKDHIACER
ncbi:excalibur calcium-binding domain-containing protein [Rummeliibacillus sp. JY-2-4R]